MKIVELIILIGTFFIFLFSTVGTLISPTLRWLWGFCYAHGFNLWSNILRCISRFKRLSEMMCSKSKMSASGLLITQEKKDNLSGKILFNLLQIIFGACIYTIIIFDFIIISYIIYHNFDYFLDCFLNLKEVHEPSCVDDNNIKSFQDLIDNAKHLEDFQNLDSKNGNVELKNNIDNEEKKLLEKELENDYDYWLTCGLLIMTSVVCATIALGVFMESCIIR